MEVELDSRLRQCCQVVSNPKLVQCSIQLEVEDTFDVEVEDKVQVAFLIENKDEDEREAGAKLKLKLKLTQS